VHLAMLSNVLALEALDDRSKISFSSHKDDD
jgi:hypothetical protein